MAAKDFTADQVRTSKLIVSGSSTAGHENVSLSVYERTGASDVAGGITDSNFYADVGQDVHIFVSGSQLARAGTKGGSVLFGGDTYISGTLIVEDAARNEGGSISGSIHHTSAGNSYMIGGTGISIASASNGQVTITSTISTDVLEGLNYYDEYNGTPVLDPLAAGTHSVAIGDGPLASGTNSIAFGNNVTGSGEHDAVVGGFGNVILQTIAGANTKNAIFGGKNNLISGSSESVIVGGSDNHISGAINTNQYSDKSGIFGGSQNKLSGSYSSILGGYQNKTEQNYSTVIGQSLTSSNTGEVVIGFGTEYAGGGLR